MPASLLTEVSSGKKRDLCQHPCTLFDEAAVLYVSTSFENRFNTANQNAGLVIVHYYWFILMANVNLSSMG